MPTYKTPGVYIEEISTLPPSVAPVATAIPAFIGFTGKAVDKKGAIFPANTPVRITSLLEFEEHFGEAPVQPINVSVVQRRSNPTNQIISTLVSFDGTPPELPAQFLYYSMQMYFENGGGPCYVVSVGSDENNFTVDLFKEAITELEKEDEPTLYVFPDACVTTNAGEVTEIANKALASCLKMQDRFTIIDVFNAIPGETEDNAGVDANFRSNVTNELEEKKYGAAYFPYLKTSLNFNAGDDNISVADHSVIVVQANNSEDPPIAGSIAAGSAISSDAVRVDETGIYNAVKSFVRINAKVTLPPSGAIAGVYASVDRTRGVWKAPANVSIKSVEKPALKITNDLNDNLNIDVTSGKSVNAIRTFAGKGTLVWGARTLAGNDNEWRYVSVRRFCIYVEESVKKATARFVFEPNDANIWGKVRALIENFLILQWRDGALAGAKPEHAFFVKVGLNETMSAQDILEGRMNIEIGMAAVRPAEFIILRFSHMMQKPEL